MKTFLSVLILCTSACSTSPAYVDCDRRLKPINSPTQEQPTEAKAEQTRSTRSAVLVDHKASVNAFEDSAP